MGVTVTGGVISDYTAIPAGFPADWSEAGKYVFTQHGPSADWALDPSYPGGVLRVAIESITGHAGLTDAELLAELVKVQSFVPMQIGQFLGTALALGLDPSRVQESMNNDPFVQRLEGILKRGDWEGLGFVINYQPSQIALTASDKTLLLGIPTQVRAVDNAASKVGTVAPATISEADVTAARAYI